MAKKNKEAGEQMQLKQKKAKRTGGIPVTGIWGFLLLLVAVSVMYANYRVFFGVDELVPRIMLAPSTLAVVVFLIYKSTK